MFVMAKKIKELFAFTLKENLVIARVRCVSSIIVVLNAKLSDLIDCDAHKQKRQ